MTRQFVAWAASIISLLLVSITCIAQGSYTLEPIQIPAGLPPALAGILETQGNRLRDPQGESVCEVWWRKVIPAQPAPTKQPGVIYGSLTPGALLGVLFFPTENEDSRDQKLKPGFYTMRYAQLSDNEPQKSGNSNLDVAVLSPAEADTRYDQILKFDDLISLSRRASRTKQAAAMSLLPVNDMYKASPAVVADDRGFCALQVRIRTQIASENSPSELRVAILLVTPPSELGVSEDCTRRSCLWF